MDFKVFFTTFVMIFLAELGDKTQLATLVYATNSPQNKMTVFLGAALALMFSSAIAVVAGAAFAQWINPKVVSWIAGLAFIAIGVWTIAR